MSIQKNFENDQRIKRKAETDEAENKENASENWWFKKENSVDGMARDSKPPYHRQCGTDTHAVGFLIIIIIIKKNKKKC